MDNRDYKQSRRFLDFVDDDFLLQALEEPTKSNDMLALLLYDKEDLMGNVKASESFSWILTVSGRVRMKLIL